MPRNGRGVTLEARACSSAEERRPSKPRVGGSNPSRRVLGALERRWTAGCFGCSLVVRELRRRRRYSHTPRRTAYGQRRQAGRSLLSKNRSRLLGRRPGEIGRARPEMSRVLVIAVYREPLSLARGAAGCAPPKGTVFSHGPAERRAASGVRRLGGGQSRLAARSLPAEASYPRIALACSGRRWRCEPAGDSVDSHGPEEDRAASGVRRVPGGQSRLAARSPPTEQARGVTGGIRTHDHRDHNPGLYQLSYGHRASDSVVRAGRLLAQRPDYRRLSDQC